jgi:hypothetical protein
VSAGGKIEIEYLSGNSSDSSVNSWDAYYESIHVCIALALMSAAALLWAVKKSLPGAEKIHP